MSKKENIALGVLVLTALVALLFWLLKNPVKDLEASLPGLDNRPARDANSEELIDIEGQFMQYAQHESSLKGKWTRFRGADFDNIVKDKTLLISSFGKEGPKVVWEADLGEGHSGAVIYDGKVYILDYLEQQKADALRCFSLETGEELWRRWYKVHIKRNHGMSRTVPAINDKYIVSIGPRCQVMCVERETGKYLWGLDMVKEYGTEVPFWYTGQCPIIENNVAILAPGGSALIIGVDCATGEVLWETPNPDQWKMSHSSIMPMMLDGKKTWVYAPVGGICAVSAEEENIGEVLWKTMGFNPSVVAPSPLVLPNNKIFMTAGYGAGSILLDIKKSGGKYVAEELQKFKPKQGMACEQQTGIFYNNQVYAILPKDAGGRRNQLIATPTDDFTNVIWTSGKKDRFGLGPYIIADDKMYIVKDDGSLIIAKTEKTGFTLLDKYRVIEGHDAWGPIAIADGYLIMRDAKKLVCLDIRK